MHDPTYTRTRRHTDTYEMLVCHKEIVGIYNIWWCLLVKNLPAGAEEVEDMGLIPRSGRTPGGGNGNPLWYSCLENPMDRGA